MNPRLLRTQSLVLSIALLLVVQAHRLSAAPLLVVGSDAVRVGDTFSLTVAIENANNLFAYQFDVLYNAAVIQPLATLEGGFLSAAGPTAFVPGDLSVPGVVSLVANTLLGPGLGAAGGGTLASLRFRALAGGLSMLSLSDVILLGPVDQIVDFSTQGGRVTVAPVVPEPPMLGLLGIAIAAALRQGRRFRRPHRS